MLSLIYDWAATFSNAFLVVVLCTIGFRHSPVRGMSFLRRGLLRAGLGILAMGEIALLAAALRFGPRPVDSTIVTQLSAPVSLLISAVVLQALGKSWLQGHRPGGRRGPDNPGGPSGSGVPAPLGPSPLVLAGRDAKPWPPAAE